jgi:glycosyltransferase involved in cell wall biosynthesis
VTTRAPRILCVHQGAELYGSDRSFLQAVQAIRQGWPTAHVRVVLAVDGPLRPLLEPFADEVVTRDLWILRLADPLATGLKGTIGLPWYVGHAARDIARADLAYINTTVVADHMLAARFAARRSVIHVREIPKARAMPVVRGLCALSGAGLIYNSAATEAAFALPGPRRAVIHNGIDAVPGATPPALPAAFTADRPLRVAMLGRINDWKGQDLLVAAAAALSAEDRARLRIRIVGSTFRDVREPIDALEAQIAAAGLTGVVTLEPFRDDPGEVYRWADLCAVPSRLPEPFGRVAAEGMAQGRAVIAADHGGLAEIVEHGRSGWLVAPNDAQALAAPLREAIADPALVTERGALALARFAGHFSADTMSGRLQSVLREWVPALRTE